MASTYSDPEWSNNMDEAVSRLSGPGVELDEAFAWLKERSKEETFSLTDVWAVMTAAGIMKYVPALTPNLSRLKPVLKIVDL